MKRDKIQHYVFNTYRRKYILIDAETVDFLYTIFQEIARAKGFEILACKILGDHVHCLIKYDAKHHIQYPIKMLKGISAKRFFDAYKVNRFVYKKLWARSYFSKEISSDQIDIVIEYINNQINKDGYDKRL